MKTIKNQQHKKERFRCHTKQYNNTTHNNTKTITWWVGMIHLNYVCEGLILQQIWSYIILYRRINEGGGIPLKANPRKTRIEIQPSYAAKQVYQTVQKSPT